MPYFLFPEISLQRHCLPLLWPCYIWSFFLFIYIAYRSLSALIYVVGHSGNGTLLPFCWACIYFMGENSRFKGARKAPKGSRHSVLAWRERCLWIHTHWGRWFKFKKHTMDLCLCSHCFVLLSTVLSFANISRLFFSPVSPPLCQQKYLLYNCEKHYVYTKLRDLQEILLFRILCHLWRIRLQSKCLQLSWEKRMHTHCEYTCLWNKFCWISWSFLAPAIVPDVGKAECCWT